MNLLANPLVDDLLVTVFSPAVLAVAVVVGLALSTGLVARSVEILQDRAVRLPAGSRSRAGGPHRPGA